MVIEETYSKDKLNAAILKLTEEEGFTKDQVETVNENMIFFKSVAEVKKR